MITEKQFIEAQKIVKAYKLQKQKTVVGRSLILTNQKLWEMAKEITDKLRNAKTMPTDKVDWDLCQELWFDWLEEELFGNNA